MYSSIEAASAESSLPSAGMPVRAVSSPERQLAMVPRMRRIGWRNSRSPTSQATRNAASAPGPARARLRQVEA